MRHSSATHPLEPPFLPVQMAVEPGGVTLSAGGESVRFRGEPFAVGADGPVTAECSVARREFLILSLRVTARRPAELRRVAWFAGEWDPSCERAVSSTGLQDAFLFLRKGSVSFFLSLDFPYSRIDSGGIWYPPSERLRPGQTLECHSLTVGACRLAGRRSGDFDVAEIEAASAYVERRHPPRFERPMFTSACITNRMTECRDGRIFYSMRDNPTVALSPALLEEDIRLMAEIGVEYFQVFEGAFDWPDERRTGRHMRRLSRLARGLGVRLGDYVHPGELYCPHYNYSGRRLDQPGWRQRGPDGATGQFCLGCPEYLDYIRERLVAHNRRYGHEFICLDMLHIAPCHAANHGHPAGDVYRQVLGLVTLMDALAALSPEYLVWTNSGNWLQFMPKLIWHNPNVYLTDPHVRGYSSTLNQLKLLGDGRREQMVTVHERHFVPYRAFCNCEYYAFPRSRVPDTRVFAYSFLQGLAVTPNICPAETRPFLARLPAKTRDECVAFMRKWMSFVRRNFGAWKHTVRVGSAPGRGDAEIYAHPRPGGAGSFVCLVNQNPFPCAARFLLDESIGLTRGRAMVVRELHPRECAAAEQALPFAAYGDEFSCLVPPHGVRFLSIAPTRPSAALRVIGHPARIRRTHGGYRITLRAAQGEVVRLGVVLPPGKTLRGVTAAQAPGVPMYTFAVAARVVRRAGNLAWIDIALPRGRAPRALTTWRVEPGGAEVVLPQPGTCGFLGALVHGAPSEELEVRIDLAVRSGSAGRVHRLAPPPEPGIPGSAPVPRARRQTFVTDIDLPFIERMGCEPGYDDDAVVELAFADAAAVASVDARLGGKPVVVQRYVYPRDKSRHSFYVELTGQTGPGRIPLELDVEWAR